MYSHRALDGLGHRSWRGIRNLVDVAVGEDVAGAAGAGLEEDGGGAGELQEEAVGPDGAAGPGAQGMGEVGEELPGVGFLEVGE